MGSSEKKWTSAIEKELSKVYKAEMRLQKAALKSGALREDSAVRTGVHLPNSEKKANAPWREKIEDKIPKKAREGLEQAFCKGFALMFEKGKIVVEKTFDKDSLAKDQEIREFAIRLKGGRRELRSLQKAAGKTNLRNLAMTAVEGAGLGALGIGLPDIVVFTGVLLKGIYETAVQYGVEYETPGEQWLMLKMMEASMAKGEHWLNLNQEIDQYLSEDISVIPSQEILQEQIEQTAKAFAMDMLLLKFVQGIPVAGIFGGAGNPYYYRKILRYVSVKYQKRYLLKLKRMGPK